MENKPFFLKLQITDETEELIKNDFKAFQLLYLIAKRRRYESGFQRLNGKTIYLEAGQSLLGDYREAGLNSVGEYREAKKRLSKCNLATFKGTGRGTIASIINKRVFDITVSDNVNSATGKLQANNN